MHDEAFWAMAMEEDKQEKHDYKELEVWELEYQLELLVGTIG